MQKYFFLLLAFAAAVPRPGAAQSLNALRQGVRIEVTPVHGKSQTGTVMSVGSDSLIYIPDGAAHAGHLLSTSSTSLGFADLRSVRVSRGRDRLAGAFRGGLIGIGTGILGGAVLAAVTFKRNPKYDCFCSRGSTAAYGGLVGSGIGFWPGLIAGVIIGRERWESVDLPRP